MQCLTLYKAEAPRNPQARYKKCNKMVAKYLPLPVSVTVSRWQNVGHRLIKGSSLRKLGAPFHLLPLSLIPFLSLPPHSPLSWGAELRAGGLSLPPSPLPFTLSPAYVYNSKSNNIQLRNTPYINSSTPRAPQLQPDV